MKIYNLKKNKFRMKINNYNSLINNKFQKFKRKIYIIKIKLNKQIIKI